MDSLVELTAELPAVPAKQQEEARTGVAELAKDDPDSVALNILREAIFGRDAMLQDVVEQTIRGRGHHLKDTPLVLSEEVQMGDKYLGTAGPDGRSPGHLYEAARLSGARRSTLGLYLNNWRYFISLGMHCSLCFDLPLGTLPVP